MEIRLGDAYGEYLVFALGPLGIGLFFGIYRFGGYSEYVLIGGDESCEQQDYEKGSSNQTIILVVIIPAYTINT